jgi:hypothetical protein
VSHFIRLSLAAFSLAAVPASAAVITPVAVEASSTFPVFYLPANLINGSGLSGGLHDGDFNNHWMSDTTGEPAFLIFDLGTSVALTDARLWQYNVDFGLDRGARDIAFSTSLDGVTFADAGTGTMARATGAPAAAQVFALDGTARYVRVDLLNNHGDRFTWTGLAEARFAGAVPEPTTWAMLIIGFGFVGMAARRRTALAG